MDEGRLTHNPAITCPAVDGGTLRLWVGRPQASRGGGWVGLIILPPSAEADHLTRARAASAVAVLTMQHGETRRHSYVLGPSTEIDDIIVAPGPGLKPPPADADWVTIALTRRIGCCNRCSVILPRSARDTGCGSARVSCDHGVRGRTAQELAVALAVATGTFEAVPRREVAADPVDLAGPAAGDRWRVR